MNTSVKKSLNDLRINPARTALVIFALVIGLWGVGSTLISFIILKNDLYKNFTETIPAHVIMTSENFERMNIMQFRQRPEIEKAEFRDLSLERVEVFTDKWIPLWLYGVEDFTHFELAKIYYQTGKKIPDPGTILVERDGLMPRVSSLKLASTPRVRVGGKILNIPISGISFDPAQAPATQDAFIYAYTDKETFTQITGKVRNQRLIFRLKNVSSKQQIQEISKNILNDFKRNGIVIKTMEIPKFNEHPHQFQLNTLLMISGIIGLLAFIMGAVMVSQLMASILAQQVRQIGILKAIGASQFKVLKIYVIMVFILGAISGLIAIPLAVASGYGYAGFVARIINFNILTTSLPHHVYVFLISLALFLPVVLSLPALWKGVRVSVLEAISDYGIRQNNNSTKRGLLSKLPFSRSMNLAFRNTLRRKKRLAVTVAAMALGVAIFSTGFNVRQSLVVFLADSRNAMKYDVQVVFNDQIPREAALSPFMSLANVDRVEAWNGGKGRLQSGKISTTNGIGIVALPPETDLMRWEIIEGRWLESSDYPEIVMNQQAVEDYGNPSVGLVYPIDIKGKVVNAKLTGIVKEFDKAKIYIDQKLYDSIANPNHLINSLMFVARDNNYKKIIALKKDIEHIIASSDLNILYVMSQAERAQIIYDHLNIILGILAFLAFLVLVVSALGMASATGINILERTREIGVLRAIGATPKMIYRLFVAEGMLVSITSIVTGVLLSLPLSKAASVFFGYLILGANTPLDFAFSKSGFIITLIITLLFGWLASRIPARKAIKVSTREALSYE